MHYLLAMYLHIIILLNNAHEFFVVYPPQRVKVSDHLVHFSDAIQKVAEVDFETSVLFPWVHVSHFGRVFSIEGVFNEFEYWVKNTSLMQYIFTLLP